MCVKETVFGNYCNRVTPLPIPNIEVKSISADDSAIPSSTVGRLRFLKSPSTIYFVKGLFL
jgi:hypothetical protein